MSRSNPRELGAFLRSRRDRLIPATLGAPAASRHRRVPGLRKEELALLAGVSVDYYSRIEQGRQATVSVAVAESLARALQLDDDERAHLFDLAALPPQVVVRERVQRPPEPSLLRIMTHLDAVPLLLLGNRLEVVARNPLLEAVLGPLPVGSSFARFLLLDPSARERIVEWRYLAEFALSGLRRETVRHPHDAELRQLVRELREADPQLAAWWNDHGVREFASARKTVRHPIVGDLVFSLDIVSSPRDPDQRLVVYTVEPGSPTESALAAVQVPPRVARDTPRPHAHLRH